jgi:hypothetical protein
MQKKQEIKELKFQDSFKDLRHGFSWWGKFMKGNNREENMSKAKKADLLDWLLAIDASVPRFIQE